MRPCPARYLPDIADRREREREKERKRERERERVPDIADRHRDASAAAATPAEHDSAVRRVLRWFGFPRTLQQARR